MTEEIKATEQQAATEEKQQVATNDEALAALDEAIAGKKDAEEEKVTAEAEDNDAEIRKALTEKADDVEEDEGDDEQYEAEQPKKKGRKPGEVTRLREKLARKTVEEEIAQNKIKELESLVHESLTPKKKAEQEEEEAFDPLDPEAYARQQKELDKIKQGNESDKFLNYLETQDAIMAVKDKDWDAKKDVVINSRALDIIAENKALGVNISDADAMKQASERVGQDLYALYQNKKKPADYFNFHAEIAAKRYATAPAAKQKTSGKGIDMAELDNLRKSAGAPTNKVAAVKVAPEDMLAKIDAEIASDAKRHAATSNW